MIIIQLHQHLCGIHLVYPLGNILYVIIRTFSGNSITENNTPYGNASEKPDIKFLYRTYPVGNTFIIDFKEKLIPENIGGGTENADDGTDCG